MSLLPLSPVLELQECIAVPEFLYGYGDSSPGSCDFIANAPPMDSPPSTLICFIHGVGGLVTYSENLVFFIPS